MKLAPVAPIVLAALLAASVDARGAELPSREAKAPTAKAKTCTVNGVPGVVMPGSDICLRLSGSVSASVAAGTLSKQR